MTSRLQRTHQTVAGFLESGIPWEQFEELNEIDWGIHEGKNWSPEIVAGYRQLVAEWQSGNFEAKVEGGESANDLSERLSRFVGILKGRTENRILICSHGRAMRCLMSVLKEEDARSMEDYNHANTGLYKVILENGEFSFERENDVRHLEGSTA